MENGGGNRYTFVDSEFILVLHYFTDNVYFVLKIQDLEATIHKKDMELNDLNARYKYYHSVAFL